MDPAEALDRIAFLLERDLEKSYKVRAFRGAARTIHGLRAGEIEQLAATHRLESLPGVGPSTARVIGEALAGRIPSYLERLEATSLGPELSKEAEALLGAIRGDCHTHSDWSDGGSPIEEMARAAAALGREYVVLTDHSARLTIAHGLDAQRLLHQLDVVDELNRVTAPFRILTGIEVDILEDGTLDQDEALLADLDVVVASVHSKLRMEGPEMTRRMLVAIENEHSDILGHCTGRIITGRGRPPSAFDADAVFRACAASGTAIEINSRPERRDPPAELLELAVELGCAFAIDSDAHAPGQLDWLGNGCESAVAAGIDAERVVNRLGAKDLVSWAERKRPGDPRR